MYDFLLTIDPLFKLAFACVIVLPGGALIASVMAATPAPSHNPFSPYHTPRSR